MTTTVRLGAVFAVLLLCNTALGVAPLEQLLEQAMHANPDIVAARAQVELANAELNRAQLKVAREVVALRSRLIALGEEIKHMEIQIRRPPGEKYQNLLTARIDTEARLAESRAQMSFLIGASVPGRPAAGHAEPAVGTQPQLHASMVDKLCKALGAPAEAQFIETPLHDVGDFFADYFMIPIVVDKSVADVPVTLKLRGVPFSAVTQSMEDVCPQIRVTVRDYGILITSKEFAVRNRLVSAVDFWKHLGGEIQEKKPTLKPEPKRKRSPAKKGLPADDPFSGG